VTTACEGRAVPRLEDLDNCRGEGTRKKRLEKVQEEEVLLEGIETQIPPTTNQTVSFSPSRRQVRPGADRRGGFTIGFRDRRDAELPQIARGPDTVSKALRELQLTSRRDEGEK